ncbi:hypothetical protein [Kalamiella sp. sgz302252]|uniref:hypothetical protein n=1 Tax=Pantoea sp. sgz302252 TaxID=3341827 RepID=UPI0036D31432
MKDSLLKGYRPKIDCKEALTRAPAFYLFLRALTPRKRFRQGKNGDIHHENPEIGEKVFIIYLSRSRIQLNCPRLA